MVWLYRLEVVLKLLPSFGGLVIVTGQCVSISRSSHMRIGMAETLADIGESRRAAPSLYQGRKHDPEGQKRAPRCAKNWMGTTGQGLSVVFEVSQRFPIADLAHDVAH